MRKCKEGIFRPCCIFQLCTWQGGVMCLVSTDGICVTQMRVEDEHCMGPFHCSCWELHSLWAIPTCVFLSSGHPHVLLQTCSCVLLLSELYLWVDLQVGQPALQLCPALLQPFITAALAVSWIQWCPSEPCSELQGQLAAFIAFFLPGQPPVESTECTQQSSQPLLHACTSFGFRQE